MNLAIKELALAFPEPEDKLFVELVQREIESARARVAELARDEKRVAAKLEAEKLTEGLPAVPEPPPALQRAQLAGCEWIYPTPEQERQRIHAEIVKVRRKHVLAMLIGGRSVPEICRSLKVDKTIVYADVTALRKLYGARTIYHLAALVGLEIGLAEPRE